MNDKVIEVLGLGPSISEYVPSRNETIGVNDIFKHHPVDRLLLMDPPGNFNEDRLVTIRNSKPEYTYSNLHEWSFMPGFMKINVADPKDGGDVSSLDNWDYLPRHVDATFTAVCIAYHLEASDIVLYGVDFKDHHLKHYKDQIIRAYSRLHGVLIQRGVLLWVGTNRSLLSTFIPNIKL